MQKASLSLHKKANRLNRSFAPAISRRLKLEWRLWAAGGVLAVGGALFFLQTHRIVSASFVGGASAAAALIYVLWTFQSALERNHRAGEPCLLPGLGTANRLTFLRGLLVCILAGFAGGMPESAFGSKNAGAWLPGILYLTAAVIDGVDGAIARATRSETQMGSELDTKMDAFGLLVAIGVAVRIGQLPLFYLPVAVAYYIFKAAAAVRQRFGKPVIPLLPRPAARAIAGMTMGMVGVALLPVYSAPATTVAAGLFMLPFCYGFLRDWLVVSQIIQTDRHQQAGWEPFLKEFFTAWLPQAFRFMIFFTALGLFVQGIDLPGLSRRSGFFMGLSSAQLFISVQALLIVMAVAGCLGRIASLGLTLMLGWCLQRPGPGPDGFVLFFCAVCLMLSGTGLYSIWQPEDRFLHRKRLPLKSF